MRGDEGIFDRVFGVQRSVRDARPFNPTYLLFFLLLFIPHVALAQCCQSNAEWIAYKNKCGLPPNLLYNDWLAENAPCPANNPASSTTTPTVTVPTTQQQLATQLGTLGGNMIASALQQLLFGSPPPPPDPAMQQRLIAAEQLNNAGIYLFKQKNYTGAINEFQKALEITPNDGNILHNLAMAKQKLNDTAQAGKTSGALAQLLGSVPANTGKSDFDQLLQPSSLGANGAGSAATQPADAQETLKSLDSVLGSAPDQDVKRQLDDFANNDLPQGSDSNSGGSAADARPGAQNEKPEADQTTKDVDQVNGQNQSAAPTGADAPAAPAPVDTGSASGPGTADAAGQEPGSKTPGSVGDPDFDGNKGGNAPLTKFEWQQPQDVSDAVDLRGTGTTVVSPGRVKGSSGTAAAGPAPSAPAGVAAGRAAPSGFSAPGAPIFDCDGDRALIARLAAGLAVQEEAIRRTQLALEAAREDAKHDSAEAREKAMDAAVKMLTSSATSIADSSEKLLAREQGLKAVGNSEQVIARFKFLVMIKKIHELGERLEAAGNSLKAGYDYGDTTLVRQTARDLTDQIAAAGLLFVDSGLAEEAGGQFATALWGPIGETGFSGLNTGIDLFAAYMQAGDSRAEADQAARNLDVMRSEYRRSQDRIYELQQELAQGCSNPKASAEN